MKNSLLLLFCSLFSLIANAQTIYTEGLENHNLTATWGSGTFNGDGTNPITWDAVNARQLIAPAVAMEGSKGIELNAGSWGGIKSSLLNISQLDEVSFKVSHRWGGSGDITLRLQIHNSSDAIIYNTEQIFSRSNPVATPETITFSGLNITENCRIHIRNVSAGGGGLEVYLDEITYTDNTPIVVVPSGTFTEGLENHNLTETWGSGTFNGDGTNPITWEAVNARKLISPAVAMEGSKGIELNAGSWGGIKSSLLNISQLDEVSFKVSHRWGGSGDITLRLQIHNSSDAVIYNTEQIFSRSNPVAAPETITFSGLNINENCRIHIRNVSAGGGGLEVYIDEIKYVDESLLSSEKLDVQVGRIFPNPFSDYLNVQLENADSFTYSILNVAGQEVQTSKTSKLSTKIPTENLSNGTYILRINAEGKEFTKKIIKQ